MMMAIQFGQTWIVLAVLVISILTSKDLSTIISFIISTAVLYIVIGSGEVNSLWPLAIFGLVVLSILLGSKQDQQQQPDYGQGGYGDMMGGMGGGY